MKKNTIKSEPFKNFKTSLNIRNNPTPETKSKNPTVFLFSEDEENTKNNNKERYVKIRIIGKDETNHQQDEDVKENSIDYGDLNDNVAEDSNDEEKINEYNVACNNHNNKYNN